MAREGDPEFASSSRRRQRRPNAAFRSAPSSSSSSPCRAPWVILEGSIGIILAMCTARVLIEVVVSGIFEASSLLHGVPLSVPVVSALHFASSSPRRGSTSAASSHWHSARRREGHRRVNLAAPFFVSASSHSSLLLASISVYFDSTNHLHRDISYHPEQPERIAACVREIAAAFPASSSGVDGIELVDVAADPADLPSSYYLEQQKSRLAASRDAGEAQEPPAEQPSSSLIRHRPFTDAELRHARTMLVEAHSESLVADLEQRCETSKQKRVDDGKRDPLGHMGYLHGDPDCYVTTESFEVCLRAASAWIRASRDALDASSSSGAAVALMRPPGHHATRTLQNGFCLYNFAAAAALSFLSENPAAKMFVLDWDVHFGQGTADILRDYPRVRFASVHQAPAFPYEGEKLEVTGEHKNILTVPISPSTTWTCGYRDAYEIALRFGIEPGVWEPDLVIVSAGFDALDSDPLATVSLQADDFRKMTEVLYHQVSELSSFANKRVGIVVGLEGGYQLDEMAGGGNLQGAVVATIRALLDARKTEDCVRLHDREQASVE